MAAVAFLLTRLLALLLVCWLAACVYAAYTGRPAVDRLRLVIVVAIARSLAKLKGSIMTVLQRFQAILERLGVVSANVEKLKADNAVLVQQVSDLNVRVAELEAASVGDEALGVLGQIEGKVEELAS